MAFRHLQNRRNRRSTGHLWRFATLIAFRLKQNVVVAIFGILPISYGDSRETNVVVTFYCVLQLTHGDSPETDEVAAIYGASPLSYGVSPETKRSSHSLRHSTTYSWRFARNRRSSGLSWRFTTFL